MSAYRASIVSASSRSPAGARYPSSRGWRGSLWCTVARITGALAASASARPKATASSDRSEPSTPMRILVMSFLASLEVFGQHLGEGATRARLRAISRVPLSRSASNRRASSLSTTTSRAVPHSPQRKRIDHRSASRSDHETGITKSRPHCSQSTSLRGRPQRRRARMSLNLRNSMDAAFHRGQAETIGSRLHELVTRTPIQRSCWTAAEEQMRPGAHGRAASARPPSEA